LLKKYNYLYYFFQKTVDIAIKDDYYYLIVILHVHFARVTKGVEEFLGNLSILLRRIK